jgi:hypothetical protein
VLAWSSTTINRSCLWDMVNALDSLTRAYARTRS